MGQKEPTPKSSHRRTAIAGITYCAVLLVSGCTGDSGPVALPKDTGPALALPSSPGAHPSAETESVKETYRQYSTLLYQIDGLPAEIQRQRLSAHTADPQLTRVLEQAGKHRTDNIVSYGFVVPHIKSVRIDGDTATLYDCQDSSNAGLMNATTREKINRGIKEDHNKALLSKQVDGQWLVRKVVALGPGC